MIGWPFAYEAPRSLGAAAAILGSAGSAAAVLGGGTVLVSNLTAGSARPEVIVDLRNLGLDRIDETDEHLLVGARTTYRDLRRSPIIQAELPLLALMSAQVTGGAQIHNQGTIGGSACYANPASDVPGCLLTLQARLRLVSGAGVREVAAADFFVDAFQTAARPDEFLSHLVLPRLPKGTSAGYQKLKSCTGSWPIVTASCLVTAAGGQAEARVRVTIGAASPVPVVTEASLDSRQRPVPDAEIRRLGDSAAGAIGQEWSDELAGPGYRRSVAAPIASRAISAALRTATP
jgi:carbon-monoxide dehydrogenase medium subunit